MTRAFFNLRITGLRVYRKKDLDFKDMTCIEEFNSYPIFTFLDATNKFTDTDWKKMKCLNVQAPKDWKKISYNPFKKVGPRSCKWVFRPNVTTWFDASDFSDSWLADWSKFLLYGGVGRHKEVQASGSLRSLPYGTRLFIWPHFPKISGEVQDFNEVSAMLLSYAVTFTVWIRSKGKVPYSGNGLKFEPSMDLPSTSKVVSTSEEEPEPGFEMVMDESSSD